MSSPLKSFKILIADSDQRLATVSKHMLNGMGFNNIQLTPSGTKALSLFKTEGFDFLITDWHLKDMDGISMIQHIRRDSDSPNPTLPVIMLTGRMEQSDVQIARDNGIHEYVVKPFSAKTIYSRLERIVEFPRYFIVDKEFVGPDRRRKQGQLPAVDRRKKAVQPQRKPPNLAGLLGSDSYPKIWLPDFSLKQKLGKNVTLETIITPDVLLQAQAAINSATDESVRWIKDDLVKLQSLYKSLKQEKPSATVADQINEVVLSISSRSGTFGYTRASEVAYMLYLFCRKKLQTQNPNHYVIIEKHTEVLQIIFGKNIRGEEGGIVEIIKELKNLTDKYAP